MFERYCLILSRRYGGTLSDKKEHVEFQRHYFDQHVEVFRQPIPDDVIQRSREIVKTIVEDGSTIRILDVGTGIGAFLKLYHERGVPFSKMLGCDLSTEMLREARQRYPEVQFWQGDVLELPEKFGDFDLIVFNACFGNIFDQQSVLKKSRSRLNSKGKIAVSHPMGNRFVQQLKNAEPNLVCTLMPGKAQLELWAKQLRMELIVFADEEDMYLAVLQALD